MTIHRYSRHRHLLYSLKRQMPSCLFLNSPRSFARGKNFSVHIATCYARDERRRSKLGSKLRKVSRATMKIDGLHVGLMCRGISDPMSVRTATARKQTSSTTVSNSGLRMRHKHINPCSTRQSAVCMIRSKCSRTIRPFKTADNAPSASKVLQVMIT